MIFNKHIAEKLHTYYVDKWGMKEYRNGWLKGDCPFCGKKNKFGVHIADSRTNCFVCGSHRNPFLALIDLERFETYTQAYNLLKSVESTPYLATLPEVAKTELKNITLPESFKLLSLGNSMIGNMARDYMKRRGFDIFKLTLKGIGYCESGKYGGCIIFPFYQQGNLVYFIARKFIHLSGAKFDNPPIEEIGIGKSFLIYNIDVLTVYNTVRVVESVTNAETLGNSAVAILGKAISNYQLNCFIKSPVKNFIIYLDPDAKYKAYVLGLKLSEYKRVKVVILPDNEDVNSYGKKPSRALEKQTPWYTYRDLFIKCIEHET